MTDPLLEPRPERRPLRPSELVGGLRELLEEEVGRVWVVGEVSNLRRPASGHCYFTLKDDRAQIRAVLFRGTAARIPFDPEDGLEVIAYGEVTVYAARGDLQVLVRQLEPRGRGSLQLAFEQLRTRLEAEGLFDPAAKRALPGWPRRVGVVTSATGAALRDVIQVSGARLPGVPLLVAPARVQGEGADAELVEALEALQTRADVDVVLLVRGGGSLEDLWPFNSERLARALRAARVPVIAGVGHEVDVTIADLAADARAPTPSAAAALALPDRRDLATRLDRDRRRLAAAAHAGVREERRRLGRARERLRAHAPAARLAAQRARLEAAARALLRSGRALSAERRGRLGALAGRLEALSPLGVLARGYALARRARDGAILRRARAVEPGEGIRVRLGSGELDADVTGVRDAGPGSR